jgi:hypothetical protein
MPWNVFDFVVVVLSLLGMYNYMEIFLFWYMTSSVFCCCCFFMTLHTFEYNSFRSLFKT